MNYFLLGWALGMTVITLFCVYLLYRKDSTTNNIDNLKQKNKRNKQSDINNDISASVTTKSSRKRHKKPRNGIFKRLIKKKKGNNV